MHSKRMCLSPNSRSISDVQFESNSVRGREKSSDTICLASLLPFSHWLEPMTCGKLCHSFADSRLGHGNGKRSKVAFQNKGNQLSSKSICNVKETNEQCIR